MLCHKFEHIVNDYLDDTLDIEGRALWDEHLAHCPRCRRTLKETRKMLEVLSSLPVIEPSADFHRRLRMRMGQTVGNDTQPLRNFWFQPGFISISVFLFLMFFSSILYFQMKEEGFIYQSGTGPQEQPTVPRTMSGRQFGDIPETSPPPKTDDYPLDEVFIDSSPQIHETGNQIHDEFSDKTRKRTVTLNTEADLKKASGDLGDVSQPGTGPSDVLEKSRVDLQEPKPAIETETISLPLASPQILPSLKREEALDCESSDSSLSRADSRPIRSIEKPTGPDDSPDHDTTAEKSLHYSANGTAHEMTSARFPFAVTDTAETGVSSGLHESSTNKQKPESTISNESKEKSGYAETRSSEKDQILRAKLAKNYQSVGIYIQGTGTCLDILIAELSPECQTQILTQDKRGDLIAHGEINESGLIVLTEQSLKAGPACRIILGDALMTQQHGFRQTQMLSPGTQLDFIIQSEER